MSAFPFDIWFNVSRYLDVRDILVLQLTSKELRSFMQERPVWHAAMQDALSMKPLPHVQRESLSMSAEELQAVCVRAAKIERSVTCRACTLTLLAELDEAGMARISKIAFLPGGRRLVTLDSANGLQLVDDRGGVLSAVPDVRKELRSFDLCVLAVSCDESLLLRALHWPSDATPGNVSGMELHVYSAKDTLELVGSITPADPGNIVYCALNDTSTGPAVVYLRGCTSREFVAHICPVDRLDKHTESTLTFRLRGWIMPSYMHDFMLLYGTITFIGSNRLVLATSCGIYVYETPSFEVMLSRGSDACALGPNIVNLSPIWATCGAWALSAPPISPPMAYELSDALGTRVWARCTVWTGHDVHTLDIPLDNDNRDASTLDSDADTSSTLCKRPSCGSSCGTGAGELIRYTTHRVDRRFTHQTVQCIARGLAVHRHRSRNDVPSVLVSMSLGDLLANKSVRDGADTSQGGLQWTILKLPEPDADREAYHLVDMAVDEVSGRIAVVECETRTGDPAARRVRIYSIAS